MLAPYIFPEKRWFFFVCGYGAGKTKANVFSLLYAVKRLQGKKDRSGDYARLMVVGYTLAHLNKTFLVYMRQILDMSKTVYTENKKDNYFVIGTVTVLVVPMENPENIFGTDVHSIYGEEIDELTEDKAIEAVRALSERTRQQIPGERSPFVCLASTSQGQKGLYRIYHHFKKSGVGFVHMRGRTEDNKFLPASMISDMRKMYSPEERCVAADEKILIRRGTGLIRCRIRRIQPRDEVFTRDGWHCVTKIKFTGKKPVGRIARVMLTEDHSVATESGWKRSGKAKDVIIYNEQEIIVWTRLEELNTIVKEALQRLSNTMENVGIDTLTPKTAGKAAACIGHVVQNVLKDVKAICCTYTFGKNTTVRCLMVLWYIMRITITIITLLKILSHYLFFNTPCCTVETIEFGKTDFQRLQRCVKKIQVSIRLAKFVERHFSVNIRAPDSVASINRRDYEKDFFCDSSVVESDTQNRSLFAKIVGERFIVHRHTLFSVLNSAKKNINRLEQYLYPVPNAVSCSWLHIKQPGFAVKNVKPGTITKEVVDIEVEKAHEFVVKGLIAHNCVFMDGEFLSIAKGRVLGDFDWKRNYLEYDLDRDVKPGEVVHIAQDFNTGFSRASAYIVRDGVIYCVKYYDFPDSRDAPSVFRYDFPEQRILWIPDVTIKDSFPQYARELRKHGVQIIYRKKNPLVEDTVFLVNKLFYTGRLMVCRIAKDVAEACALAMRDKDNKIPKGVGSSSPIHTVDTVRYACSFIAARDKAFRDIRALILDKRASFRADGGKPVQDLGSGYMQIDPDALYRGKKL
jgi:hypothetical protein